MLLWGLGLAPDSKSYISEKTMTVKWVKSYRRLLRICDWEADFDLVGCERSVKAKIA